MEFGGAEQLQEMRNKAKTAHRDGPGKPWMKIVDENSEL